MLREHLKKIVNCGFFSAPRTPVKPYAVEKNIELVEVITGGVVFHEVNGKEKVFRKGAIFWHQHGEETIHRTSPEDPYRCLYLHFETDGTPRMFSRYSQWTAGMELNGFIEDMLRFKDENMLDSEYVFLYASGTLLRHFVPHKGEVLPGPLRKACRILSSDPAQDISVDEVSRKTGVSKSHLFTLFRKHLKSSPYSYLLSKRIELARELLVTRLDIPIKQISESCGFKTLEIFYRRFRQYTGTSPAAYRADNTSYLGKVSNFVKR